MTIESTIALDRRDARVLAYLLERLPVSTRGRCFTVPLSPDGAAEAVVTAPLTAVPGAAAVFTLARGGGRVAITFTDGDPVAVGEILARAARSAPAGDASRLVAADEPYLAAHGRAGLAFVPPSCGRWLPGVPDLVRIDGETLQLSMATFLSAREVADAREAGLDAIVAAFGRGERDLLRFARREQG